MKKAIFVLLIAASCLQLTAHAQKSAVGFSGGITIPNIKGPLTGLSNSGSSRTGYSVSLFISTPLGGSFSFEPAVSYVQKGSNRTQVVAGATQKVGVALRYAELPFNFLYNLNMGGAKFFIGAGPYGALNLPSKKVTGSSKAVSDVIFGDKTGSEDMKGIDYGANFLAGIRMKGGFSVSFNYSLGIRDLASSSADQGTVKNNYFGIQLGYLTKKTSKSK